MNVAAQADEQLALQGVAAEPPAASTSACARATSSMLHAGLTTQSSVRPMVFIARAAAPPQRFGFLGAAVIVAAAMTATILLLRWWFAG